MKRMLVTAVAVVALALGAQDGLASEPARDRAKEAQDVTALLGLSDTTYRVVSAEEANQVRGTGGLLHGLLNIKVNVYANVKLLDLGKVKVNAYVRVR